MKVTYLVQTRRTPDNTIVAALTDRLRKGNFDDARVAMAYVTVAGVRALLEAFPSGEVNESQWLVGLDDAITQPGAIELLMDMQRAEVRVASLGGPLRFHPKVCLFSNTGPQSRGFLMVGSANLTRGALDGNSEAVVFSRATDARDMRLFRAMWKELWSQGHRPSSRELASYTIEYELAKKARALIPEREASPPSNGKLAPVLLKDDAELDPSMAATCWIECGYITAQGRELEFKAEQGLFFGLSPFGGPRTAFQFRTSKGTTVTLALKYQENHMWRLQMNNDVPEVKRGLRPRLAKGSFGRSDKVAVFHRTELPSTFDLRFVGLGSRAFAALKRKSSLHGTVGHTTARSYGWC